ncbi:MAG: NfeD family protein [Gammaproteobacteria bacterium]|nr:NfeD family protein [Gammaproteobacteria bacterium]MCZ6584902.1 NfeD family protein [Gammaproteobacteria bacterium]
MDLLSGLLLTGVVLWIIYIVVRQLFDEKISSGLTQYFRTSPNPVQDNLVGSIGKVVDVSDDKIDILRVRIGIELWSAKLQAADQPQLPIGAEVKVIAVNGMILDVEEHAVT